jgi:hypothetical protein
VQRARPQRVLRQGRQAAEGPRQNSHWKRQRHAAVFTAPHSAAIKGKGKVGNRIPRAPRCSGCLPARSADEKESPDPNNEAAEAGKKKQQAPPPAPRAVHRCYSLYPPELTTCEEGVYFCFVFLFYLRCRPATSRTRRARIRAWSTSPGCARAVRLALADTEGTARRGGRGQGARVAMDWTGLWIPFRGSEGPGARRALIPTRNELTARAAAQGRQTRGCAALRL